MDKQTARLEKWFTHNGRLTGDVYDHPHFDDGEFVTTSPLVKKERDHAETENTHYTLGKHA